MVSLQWEIGDWDVKFNTGGLWFKPWHVKNIASVPWLISRLEIGTESVCRLEQSQCVVQMVRFIIFMIPLLVLYVCRGLSHQYITIRNGKLIINHQTQTESQDRNWLNTNQINSYDIWKLYINNGRPITHLVEISIIAWTTL